MEILTNLGALVPELSLAILVIIFVLRWRREDSQRDQNWREFTKERDKEWRDFIDKRDEDYKGAVSELSTVIKANTAALTKSVMSKEQRDRLVDLAYQNRPVQGVSND